MKKSTSITINHHTFVGGLDDVGEPISCSGDDWGLLVGILFEAPVNEIN